MNNVRLACNFHVTESNNEPVREWLKGLTANVRKAIGDDIRFVQQGWPVGKPYIDGFGKGLFEVRTSYNMNIYRVFFHIVDSEMILLHGILKKTGKTPARDLSLARDRQKLDVERSRRMKGGLKL